MFAVIAALAASPLTLTLGEVDLTPPAPLPLGGYSERNGAVGAAGPRPLRARLVLLSQGGKRLVLASVEMLTLPESLRDAVQAQLPPGISLFLGATHTHSAPDSQMLNSRMTFRVPGIEPFRQRELDRTSKVIADGIKSLLTHRSIEITSLELETWKADANRPRRPGGIAEKDVWMVKANGKDLLGIYAAHPTLHEAKELEVSGDWPGQWMVRGPWMALTGPIGDVSPQAEGLTGGEKSRALVENLVQSRVERGKTTQKLALQFSVTLPTVGLPSAIPHPDFAQINKISPLLAQLAVKKFAPEEAHLTLVNLGGIVVIGVPGEPTGGVARRLRTTALYEGWPRAITVSHVNGWAGYMLEPEDYSRGGYEAGLHFYGPTLASRLAAAVGKGLHGLERFGPPGAERASSSWAGISPDARLGA
jgi:neutral ceramidase